MVLSFPETFICMPPPASAADDLLALHASTGGCVSLPELAARLRLSEPRCTSLCDRWVRSRCVLPLPDAGRMQLPAYQIDFERGMPWPAIAGVLAELAEVFDPAETVRWFVTPNVWLADQAPAQLVVRDPRAVVGAASADRFIAVG